MLWFLFLLLVSSVSLPQTVNKTRECLALRNVSIDTLRFLTLPDKAVQFRLVTRLNSSTYQLLNLGQLAVNYSINVENPFKFLTHGYLGSADTAWVQKATTQFLNKANYNVIQVDWSGVAKKTYPLAARYTKSVGNITARLIEALHRNFGVPLQNIHLIGSSLGAHISGFTGAFVQGYLQSKVSRVTGLDPAGPLFLLASKKNRLNPSDAKFVDVIHTDGNMYGYLGPLGTTDFYPQGGIGPQPACNGINIYKTPAGCSHKVANQYFIESIASSAFIGTNCTNYVAYILRQCRSKKYKTAIMGENIPLNTTGIYYLTVKNKPPYAMNGVIKIF